MDLTYCTASGLISYGAQGRDRTTDTVIFSHVLYQLSYLGICAREGPPKGRAGVIEARFWAVQNSEKSPFRPLAPGTGAPLPALTCVDKGAAFPGLLGSTGKEP